MAAHALAPYITVAMLLTMQDKLVLVFHEEQLQIPAPSLYQEMI